MSFIPDGFGEAIIQLEYVAGPSNPMAIVVGYSHAGVNGDGHAEVIGGTFGQQVMVINALGDNLLFTGCRVLENPGGVGGLYSASLNGPSTDPTIPPQVAALCRKNTGTGGPHGRGRSYLPGLTNQTIEEGGYIDAGFRNQIQEAMNDWLLGMDTNDLPMHVLHATASPAPSLVVSFSVQAVLATQRRRIR